MEDIYPDIEKTDDMTSTALQKAPTHQGKLAVSRGYFLNVDLI